MLYLLHHKDEVRPAKRAAIARHPMPDRRALELAAIDLDAAAREREGR